MGKTINQTIKFTGQFDVGEITKGLQDIKKQMSNSHIGEDLRKQLETALNKVEVNIPALEKMASKGEYNSKELEAFQKIIQQVSKDMLALDKLASEADFTKAFSEADTNKLKGFEKQLNEVENKLKTTRKEILNAFSNSEQGKINGKSNNTLNGFIEQLINVPPDQIEDKLNEIIKEAESQAENTVDKLKQDFSTRANKNKIHKEDFLNLIFGENSGVTFKEGKVLDDNKDKSKIGARTIYNQIREEILALKEDASSKDIEEILNKYHAFIEEYFNIPEGKQSVLANIVTPEIVEHLKKLSENIPELKQALGEDGLKLLAEGEAEKLRITTEQTTFMKQSLDELVKVGKITKEQAEAIAKALGLLNDQAEKGKNQIHEEESQIKALNATFGSLASKIEHTFSAMAIFNRSMQIVRQAVRSVEELDAAFTQIAIVSEQSNEAAWKMFDSFNKLAKQYSITTKDLTEGAKLFYQQGLNAADTMKMVEASTVSAALGEVTMTEAANTLTAAIQGYNESAAVAMDYTDKIAMVGAVSAADFNELSAAMEKTASSAYTAGIDFDHLLGYLGKMIEVTREAPANLGTAMKTIIARFEDMKKDPNALIDGASANKVESALATIGIALRDAAGEFRPLQDVFDELGKKWQDLTRNQQAYIATVAAGSRQQSRFLAMMNNYDRTLDLIVESQNSAGAAAQQYAIYQDSIAAAQARLTASWENFYSKIVDNGAIKMAINGLSSLVEALSHVPPAITAIGASISALTIQHALQKKGGLIKIIENALGKDADKSVAEIGINLAKNFIKNFKDKSDEEIKNSVNIWGNLTKSLNESNNTLEKTPKLLTNIGTGFKTIAKVVKNFIAANWQIIVITAAITSLIILLNQAAQKVNNLAEKINELKTEANEKFNTASNLKELLNTYDELTSKIVLTEEEQKTLNSTIENIGSSYEGAITYVNEYGNMVLANTETVKNHTQALKEEAYEMEKNAIELKRQFLESNPNKWTKENFTNAGFGEYWEQFNSTKSVLGGASPELLNAIETNGNMTFTGLAENPELMSIYDQVLKIQKTTDIWMEDGESLAEWWARLNLELNNISDSYFDIIKLMEKSVDIEELKNEINHDNTLDTEQQIMAYKVLGKLSDSSLDQWEALKEALKNSDISLKDFIITLSKAKNSDQLFNNIQEFLSGNLEKKSLEESFSQAGIINADIFIDSFEAEFKAEEDRLNKMIQDWADKNGITVNIENLDYNEKKLYSELLPLFQEGGPLYKKQSPLNLSGVSTEVADELNLKNKNTRVQQFTIEFETGDNGEKLQSYLDRIENEVKNKNIKVLNEIEKEAEKEFGANGPLLEIIKLYAEEGKENIIWQFCEADDEIFDSYQKAYNIFKKDIDKALTDKELEFIGTIGVDLTPYIEINEQGEQFLSIMGKVILLQKTSEDYEKEILRARATNLEAIGNIEKELEKIPDKEREISKEHQLQIKQYSEDLASHKKTINLLDERLKKLKEIQEAQQKALLIGSNIAKAKEIYDNVENIGKAYKEALENQGNLSFATAQSLLQMSDFNAEFLDIVDGRIKLTEQGALAMKKIQEDEYNTWLEQENAKIDYQIGLNTVLRDEALALAQAETQIDGQAAADQLSIVQNQYEIEHKDQKEALEKSGDQQEDALKQYVINWATALQTIQDAANTVFSNIATGQEKKFNVQEYVQKGIANLKPIKVDNPLSFNPIDTSDLINLKDPKEVQAKLKEMAAQYQRNIDSLTKLKELLPSLSKSIEEGYKKGLQGASSSSKDAEKALDALNKAVEKLTEALKDLDDLLKDVNSDLKDISIDYNPFTKLFEEWEHEWDKFYNIKQLMKQIELQGNLINNIIDSDWATVDQKVKARKSSIGNIIEAMSANDLYIQALRETLTEEEAAFMEKYGRYGGVDTDNLTLYEKTANLHEMNDTINEVMLGIYNLEKELNDLGNQTNLFENQMQAAEDLQSTYESIVDTIDNTIEDLENNENITTDTSGLKTLREQFKTVVESGLLEGITDFNSDEFKEKFAKFNIEIDENSKIKTIDDLKDLMFKLKEETQNIEIQVELETDVHLKDLEDFVEDYEAMQDRINEFWETLYSQVSNQEELLQKLAEERNYYIDNAISIEKELYDAIVENYQKEIDKKKKQYDELKQLDNEYLQSVRESINKEREMRNNAEKKKSYQQNIQRAQLLQMDTSGTYRAELASLNKEIKNQRDELYDDLVDKQVEALEKEIEARHELYDKEVAAMEERLNYMQENSILIWEQVNNIISEGSTAMMAILENTTTFMNSNELERQKIRENWELSTKNAYEAVNGTVIDTLEAFIVSARENIINKTPEVANAIDAAEETYRETERIAKEMGFNARNIAGSLTVYNEAVDVYRASIDAFRTEWIAETNQFTTHMETWGTSIEDLEKETRENIARIRTHNLEYNGILDSTAGSIKAFNEGVVQSVSTLYDIFISDRENYKIGLTNVINSISTEITQAITAAANAIKTAAENVQFTPQSSPQSSNPQPSNPQPSNPQPTGPQPSNPIAGSYKGWKASFSYYNDGHVTNISRNLGSGKTESELYNDWVNYLNDLKTKFPKAVSWGLSYYKTGGLANFTGPAWLDGTKSNPERVLSPRQTKLFESMVSSLEKTANNSTINSGFNSSYNIGEIKTVIQVDRLDNQTDINKLAKQVEDKIVKDIRNRVSISINKGV